LLADADIFICTSHEEGLGLPLLEAQYAGLPIVAPDAPIFREVLGASGIMIDPTDPKASAAKIAGLLSGPEWRSHYASLGARNLRRWNALANSDHDTVITMIEQLTMDPSPVAPPHRSDRIVEH
jgi:glycosyltransferase involved in cell wall biosynthesis